MRIPRLSSGGVSKKGKGQGERDMLYLVSFPFTFLKGGKEKRQNIAVAKAIRTKPNTETLTSQAFPFCLGALESSALCYVSFSFPLFSATQFRLNHRLNLLPVGSTFELLHHWSHDLTHILSRGCSHRSNNFIDNSSNLFIRKLLR
jgi:hypothetical protein